MENVLNFLADYYLYFMIGAVVLLFALIGFAVQGRKKKVVDENPMTPLNNVQPNVPVNNPMMSDVNAQMVNNNVEVNAMSNMNTLIEAQTPSTPITNNENMETLTLEPLSNEPVNNNGPEMLDLTPASSEPVNNKEPEMLDLTSSNAPTIETLDLGAIPVSMEPEQPAAQITPNEPVMSSQPTAPVEPRYNNTIQQ